ncbi:MAG: cytochrome c [bacterium]|nr:cytochrome c [bacterium]
MHVGLRKTMMAALVAAFVGQTALVYADGTADRTPPLSELALEGRRIWHANNCQACHQIYGFGGFLGPDLTNAGARMTTERLTEILTDGNAQMPAFGMNEDQIAAIEQFLIELDKTGVGVPRANLPPEPQRVFDACAEHAKAAPAAVQQGFELFRTACSACHTPLCATPLGPNTAPDLSTVRERLSDEEILKTITEGRLDRGMPAWPLGEPVKTQILPFLTWLGQERASISSVVGETEQSGLPWWEFK